MLSLAIYILIFTFIILAFFYLILREILKYQKAKVITGSKEQIQAQRRINIDQAVDGVIAAIPEIEKTIKQQQDAFLRSNPPVPLDEQKKVLKPLQDRLNQAYWIRDHEMIVRIAAPYLDGVLKGLLRMFSR